MDKEEIQRWQKLAGEKLLALATRRRLSQTKIAKATGIKLTSINRIFNGEQRASFEQMWMITNAIGVPCDLVSDRRPVGELPDDKTLAAEADILETARDIGHEVAKARLRRPSSNEIEIGGQPYVAHTEKPGP